MNAEKHMNLKQLIDHARRVYGRRNSVHFRGTPDRIGFLLVATGDLHDAIKKRMKKAVIAHMLGRVVSRIFCVIDAYKVLPLVEIMARKYPLTHCTYCHKCPCKCGKKRPDYVLMKKPSSEQLKWSLKEWCTAFNRMYGRKNEKCDAEILLLRLYKEITELLAIASRPETIRGDLLDGEREIALEIADILAWTIAIANHFGIDLESQYLKLYGDGCPNCHGSECHCAAFRYGQLDWRWYSAVGASKPSRRR